MEDAAGVVMRDPERGRASVICAANRLLRGPKLDDSAVSAWVRHGAPANNFVHLWVYVQALSKRVPPGRQQGSSFRATADRDYWEQLHAHARRPASPNAKEATAETPGDSRSVVTAQKSRCSWEGATAEADPPSGGSRRFFDHLLEYHNEKFAGRDGEVRTILDHIDRHECGYVFVDGLSGYGKTSLLAVLVRQQPGYLYHFISQRYKTAEGDFDPTRPEDLLSNLCEQLEPHRAAPLGGRALTTRFREAVAAARDRPTVLVLDAIDEVNQHPSFLHGLLPRQLPKNLFILLSARSQGDRSYLTEVGLTPDGVGLRVTLGGLGADAVHDLLLHHAGTAGAALSDRVGFVDTLREVSEGDPFYLRFLVEDVEHGRLTPENIRRTPSGLYQYLDEQFDQLHRIQLHRVPDRDRQDDVHLHAAVLGLILAADGPLHRSDLLRQV
ncbi:ATP-binding protein, partial [Saccharothrix sp. ST-888]|uniref:ATP-binding protein n=1 Tax=Saccharothrix sp. ST-888 TaxID=1427391 RepID=UPI0012DFE9DE